MSVICPHCNKNLGTALAECDCAASRESRSKALLSDAYNKLKDVGNALENFPWPDSTHRAVLNSFGSLHADIIDVLNQMFRAGVR